MPVDLARVEALFSEALSKSTPAERDAFLDQACGSDLELRGRIESLLAASEAAGSFMAPPDAGMTSAFHAPLHERPGSKIGRYKLLEQIGEGGFGVVFMAEQNQPVRRRVALKVIKLGMDTKQVVARFEAERQALAMMDHPHIAKVLDAGATETGRPYFVMELVKGIPITDYCDQQELSTRDRLDLFVDVCRAVQHAHQRGIIHRDIKPSNVLLTLHDDKAVPKVIDFGIAKATQARLTEKTLFTEFRQLIGTPAYMSPEQAQMTGLDVDTRSDIYSLGVMLYELLTGSTPFDSRRLSSGGLDEMRRIIREVEPPPPSSRLSSLGADRLGVVAHQRRCDPQRLGRLVEGDLDWIVMRCLEKDRTRRYDTAVGLAEDIQRHLSDEPVQARPPTLAYRTRKFVRRNKVGVLAASAIAAAILLGLAFATGGFIHARRQTEIARTEAARSRQTAQFLTDMLKGVGPSVAMGRDTTMLREIVDKTAERVDEDLNDQPEVAIDLRLTLASVYRDLQLFKKMEETARETVRMARAHFGEENLALADALGQLGLALMYIRVIDEAEVVTRQSIAMHRMLRGDGSLEEAEALANLGDVLKHKWGLTGYREDARHVIDEAESAARVALAIRRKQLGNDSEGIARALHDLSQVLDTENKQSEAEDAARAAVAISQRLFGDDHPLTASCSSWLGNLIGQSANRLAEAEPILRKALETLIKTQGDGKLYQHYAHAQLASVLERQGKYDEAEIHFRAALAIARKEMGPDYPDLVLFLSNLARFLRDRGRPAEARPLAEEAFAACQRLPDRIEVLPRQNAFIILTDVLTDLGDTEAIEPAATQFVQNFRVTWPDDPYFAVAVANLANILRQNGKLAEARQLAEEAVAICLRHPERAEPWQQYAAFFALSDVLTALDDTATLESVATQILRNLRANLPADDPRLPTALANLSLILRQNGKLPEARSLAEEAVAICQRHPERVEPWHQERALLALRAVLTDPIESSRLEAVATEFLQNSRAHLPPDDPWLAVALADLANVLRQNGKLAEAHPLAEEAVTICLRQPDKLEPWQQDRALMALRDVVKDPIDSSMLEAVATKLLQNSRARLPADDPWLAVAVANLANILRQNGKLAEARPLAEEAVSICQRHPDRIDGWMLDHAFSAFRQVLTQLGDTAALEILEAQLSQCKAMKHKSASTQTALPAQAAPATQP